VGVNIDYSCREGWCGVCTVKLISGQVTMAVDDALTPEDKVAGIILACQAKSTGNIQVEA
jgi:ferredoxin